MAEEYLHDNRPSRNDDFVAGVLRVIAPNQTEHGERIYSLFEMEDRPDTFQWRAGRLAHAHVDWSASRIGCEDGEEGERVVTAAHVYAITMRISSVCVRAAGYNYWVTDPAYRDRQAEIIEQTLAASMAALHEAGYDLSVTFDDEAFWMRHGYVFGWRALQWTVDSADLPASATDRSLQRFQPGEREEMAAIFNGSHNELTGTAVRPTYRRDKHPGMFLAWFWTDSQGRPAGYISGGGDRHYSLDPSVQADLDQAVVSRAVCRAVAEGTPWDNVPLGPEAVCTVQEHGSRWLITDGDRRCFIARDGDTLQAVDFDRALFWVDEIAGDPDIALQVLGQLARQWNCEEIFFDRLHYKSAIGKRLRQLISCRIHTGTFSRSPRSYVIRIINLRTTFEKLAPMLADRLQRSVLSGWQGDLLISTGEEAVMLAINAGSVAIVPVAETIHAIRGGQAIAQLVVGSESPDEIVEMAGIELSGDAGKLLPVLFPAQYPQMGNQAL